MANAYITLQSSDTLVGGKFRVIYEGYNRVLSKTSQVARTVGGGLDVSQGAVYEVHEYTIKVRHTESESGYGDKVALEDLYKLNNPGGTPSNVITFVDHYGTSHTCYMIGDLTSQTLGIMIEGTTAWFLYRVTLQIIPA